VEAPVVRSPAHAVRAREWETEPGGMYPGGPESSGKRWAGRLSTEGSTSTVPPYGSNTEVAAGTAFNDIDSDTVGSGGDFSSPPYKLAALESLAPCCGDRRRGPRTP
jgi:hypothetical protein